MNKSHEDETPFGWLIQKRVRSAWLSGEASLHVVNEVPVEKGTGRYFSVRGSTRGDQKSDAADRRTSLKPSPAWRAASTP